MDETIRLIKMAHEGDKEARETLVLDNVGLVWSIVRRFAGRGCEMEDLFQIGSIGLIKAIDKFDVSYDVRFSTYAAVSYTHLSPRSARTNARSAAARTCTRTRTRWTPGFPPPSGPSPRWDGRTRRRIWITSIPRMCW